MTLIDRILENNYEFPEIDPSELFDIEDQVKDLLKKFGADQFYRVIFEPYGTGFKMIFKRNDASFKAIQSEVDSFLTDKLRWEQIDKETGKDGTTITFWR